MTLTRKQREIRDREIEILALARRMVLERGYLGLTMDRIAAEMDCSKGTIYQHFANKEDLLAALMLDACRQRLRFFERAATFRGTSRERMTAIGVADEMLARTDPVLSSVERLLKTTSIREKASDARNRAILDVERGVLGVIFGIFRDAIASGDLELAAADKVEDLTLGLWALHMGTRDIAQMETPLAELGFSDPFVGLRRNAQVLLDGMGWRPHSSQFDAEGARARILDEVFSAELEQLPRP